MTSQEDPFASVRLKNRNPKTPSIQNNQSSFSELSDQSAPQESKEISSQEDPFSSVRVKKAEGFPFLAESGRHIARTASRIGEFIGGIPGDIQSLIQSGVFAGLEKLVGIPVSKESYEKVKKDRAPTSQELREFSEKATGGYTSPQNDLEKNIDEFVGTAASLLGPMKFRKALGVGLGSQIAKKGIETLGLGEGSQEAGKLGTMFLLSTMNPGGALKYASSQYEKANSLAKGASIIFTNPRGNLENLLKDLQKGVKTPSKNAVIRPIEDILGKVNNNKIQVQDLTAAKRDLNTLMKDPELLKRERKLLKTVGKEIDNGIKTYEKINPAFSKAYRPANEIYGAVMQGTKAADFVKSIVGTKSVLGAVIGETLLGHPELIIPTAGAAAGALGTAKTVDFLTRMAKSPQLQKYYSKAMIAAAAEDAANLRTYSSKIEEELQKD